MDRDEQFRQLAMDYMEAFSTEGGKRVLADLSRECYENSITFIRNEPDSTAYNSGKRYVILRIRKMLNKLDKPRQKSATNER